MTIHRRLIAGFVAAVLPTLIIQFVGFGMAKSVLEKDRISKLNVIADLKVRELEIVFERLKGDMRIAQNYFNVRTNLPILTSLSDNKNSSAYRQARKNLDGQLRAWLQKDNRLRDFKLVSPKGHVVYNINPAYASIDLGNPLPDPAGQAFREGRTALSVSKIFKDHYQKGQTDFFLSGPVYDFDEKFIGVLVFQINTDPIVSLMEDRTGLGETGEVLVAASGGISMSYLNRDRHQAETTEPAYPFEKLIQQEDESGIIEDHNQMDMLAAWRTLPSLGWGLVAKIHTKEAFAPVTFLRNVVIAITIVLFLLWILLASLLSKSSRDFDQMRVHLKNTTEERDRFFTMALDMLCICSTDGYFKRLNPSWEKTLGYTLEELQAKPMFDFVHPSDRESARHVTEKLKERGSIDMFENRYLCKNGDIKWLRWSAVADPSQNLVYAMARDVTEQKMWEHELRRAKETADGASRAKSNFLANMSHEIRTPMNGILGMVEICMETKLNEEQREYLTYVKSSGEHLLLIINDILDYSKIEAGALEMESIEFGLRETVDTAIQTLAPMARKKGLELISFVDLDVPDNLVGDPNRLRQILLNTVGNAIKFTQKGEVILHVGVENVSPARLTFRVEDTGCGIPKDKQAKIFEKFSQADTSVTRRYGGTGLGTTISKQLIELMDGRIWLESPTNKSGVGGPGTTVHFVVTLREAEKKFRALATPPEDLNGLRALVIDDNNTNRRIYSILLDDWGLKVTTASSGPEGLESLWAAESYGKSFAVVLLDVMMPDMDGFQVVEKMKEKGWMKNTAVIILTSAHEPEETVRAKKLGVTAILGKPVTSVVLKNTIQKAIQGGDIECLPEVPSGLSILLVEDNHTSQVVEKTFLMKCGHQVTLAESGQEAVDAVKKEDFDFIFMDIQMPGMDGLEATQAIRQWEEGKSHRNRIVAMTAHAMAGDREHYLESGMDNYISKPLKKEDLNRVIRQMITKKPPSKKLAPLLH